MTCKTARYERDWFETVAGFNQNDGTLQPCLVEAMSDGCVWSQPCLSLIGGCVVVPLFSSGDFFAQSENDSIAEEKERRNLGEDSIESATSIGT